MTLFWPRWLTALLVGIAAAAAGPTPLECPLPDGPGSASPAVCARYTACVWTGTGCRLTDRVGYRVQKAAGNRGPTRQLRLTKLTDATLFGGDVQELALTVTRYDRQRMRLTFRDSARPRYEVPLALDLPSPGVRAPRRTEYGIHLPGRRSQEPFSVGVSHAGRHALRVLPQLTYSDQFIEVTLQLAAQDVYGMGENNHDSFRHDLDAAITWPIFARDHPPESARENLYGAHPFFAAIEDDSGRSFGVLFLNSNAMEYKVFRLNGTAAVTFRTVGGILDMCLFFGRSPLEVLRQYHLTIGRPALPSYWALGFQLSRFGYRGTDDIRRIHARNRAAGIPQDVQYSDIDYMDTRRDFTVQPKQFGDLAKLVGELRGEGVHLALIYDPALAIDFGSYPPVDRGVAADVFVRWCNSSLVPPDQCAGCRDYVVGYVWPQNKTLFPDFFQSATVSWWTDEMQRFLELAGGPDGFWIDMNEPSNFGTNMDKPFNWPNNLPPWSLKCPQNNLDSPPYPTMYVRDPDNESKRLSDKTICMSTKHINDVFPAPFNRPAYRHPGSSERRHRGHRPWRKRSLANQPPQDRRELLHYDTHNLYGWSETHATRRAMDVVLGGRRGLLVGRSTFPGAGRWASHWFGDNTARWNDMHRSVVRMFEFGMFGIPHVGADICGFNGNTTRNLCLRWMQLGAFYPFCRNHNTDDGIEQDPAAWPSVAAASRDALGLRYRLLPYLYTLMYRAAAFGATVVRSLAFEFPTHPELRGVDTQFLWGSGMMVAPILSEQSQTRVQVTFPPGDWFDLRNGSLAHSSNVTTAVTYDVPLSQMIPVFARGGAALPMQPNASTTAESRRGAFWLGVFGRRARGELYWDDGESSDSLDSGHFYHCFFHFSGGVLKTLVDSAQTQWMETPLLQRIIFHGVPKPASVTADGTAVPAAQIRYESGVLTVTVQLHMGKDHVVQLHPGKESVP
ncbi:Maltase-glucoamylase, intestinal [Amphibalanus amphitrite]|uniref:Maltase-glucoamylase, intestinal n=1 Tax=Amphibalanus amphitrite TaxID=1232801 RepID=A0A6A4W8X6_AMPAM|nr:Maltase-glucoamylase, intestinal [Amphibalanus amphitrite]